MRPSPLSTPKRLLAALSLLLSGLAAGPAAAAEILGYDGVALEMSLAEAQRALQGRDSLEPCRSVAAGWSDCLTYLRPGKSFATRVTVLFRDHKVQHIKVVPEVDALAMSQALCRQLYQGLRDGVQKSIGKPSKTGQGYSGGGPPFSSTWVRGDRHARVGGSWSKKSERCVDSYMEFVNAPPADPFSIVGKPATKPLKCRLEPKAKAWAARAKEIDDEMKARDAKHLATMKEKLQQLAALGNLSEEQTNSYQSQILSQASEVSAAHREKVQAEIAAFLRAAKKPSSAACLKMLQLQSSTKRTLKKNEETWQLFIATLDQELAKTAN